MRFGLPILIAVFVKIITLGLVNGWDINVLTRINAGPGWYYVYIVLQLIIVLPILFVLVKRFGWKTLIGTFIFSTGFDLICWGAQWDVDIYKCFIPKFCFIISAGMYIVISIQNNKKYKWYLAIPMFIIGLTVLILTYYFDLPMHVNHRWFHDCTLANLYIIPILSLLVRLFKMKNQRWWTIVGKSTFNIFLCQNILLTFPIQINIASSFVLQVLLNESISFSSGLLFWFGEHKLTFTVCSIINKIKNNP